MTTLEVLHTTRAPAATTARTGLSPWLAGLWSVAYLGLAGLHLVRDTGAIWVPTPAAVLGSLSSTDVSALVVVLAALSLVELGSGKYAGLGLALAALAHAARRAGDR